MRISSGLIIFNWGVIGLIMSTGSSPPCEIFRHKDVEIFDPGFWVLITIFATVPAADFRRSRIVLVAKTRTGRSRIRSTVLMDFTMKLYTVVYNLGHVWNWISKRTVVGFFGDYDRKGNKIKISIKFLGDFLDYFKPVDSNAGDRFCF